VRTARRIGIVGLAAAAVIGCSPTGASAVTEPKKRTVASVQTNVKARVLHITTKMRNLQTRVAANKHFTPAVKATIQADIVKVLNDTAIWRKKIASATTLLGIQAATPARQAVTRDIAKLRADLTAARRKGLPAAK